jgi:hypothetical protein
MVLPVWFIVWFHPVEAGTIMTLQPGPWQGCDNQMLLELYARFRDYIAMHNADSDLSADRPVTAPLPTRELLEAIARRVCVTCVYNKTNVVLAPHIVYTKHDELFVDAVPVEREGKPPRELKVGTFKLAGLNDTAITARKFDRFNGFDPRDPKYSGVTIFAIEG